MKKFNLKTDRHILTASFLFIIICSIFFMIFFIGVINKSKYENSDETSDKLYHILITGNNENELFLKQVYDGAYPYAQFYNALLELYVPESHAEDISPQSLFEYASYINADGIIAYINNTEEAIQQVYRIDETPIPIVTIGQFAPNTSQISYIGTSYWELGRVFGREIISSLQEDETIIINNPNSGTNINYSTLTNSILSSLKSSNVKSYEVCNEITEETIKKSATSNVLLIGLTEEDTLKIAQLSTEIKTDKKINIIGFGNNETCHMYLAKGTIKKLVALDPRKIGESAIKELFEYRNKGYANSYVVSEPMVNIKNDR